MTETHRTGLAALGTATTLLQRVRRAHPTRGLFEAADLQWWWRTPRPTDDLPQLFWLDEQDRPEAAAVLVAWGDEVALVPILLPDAAPDRVAEVVDRALAHAGTLGVAAVDLEVDEADDVLRQVLADRGFVVAGAGTDSGTASVSVVESWLAVADRPPPSALVAGHRLETRRDTASRPHHMARRGGPGIEERLRQTSLYRPELDLVVLDDRDEVAAVGLCWFDPATATGLVEPMRTEDDHQRQGLARHVLTTGLDLLARAGADRVKICFAPDNVAARGLYLDVGFAPVKRTIVCAGRTS